MANDNPEIIDDELENGGSTGPDREANDPYALTVEARDITSGANNIVSTFSSTISWTGNGGGSSSSDANGINTVTWGSDPEYLTITYAIPDEYAFSHYTKNGITESSTGPNDWVLVNYGGSLTFNLRSRTNSVDFSVGSHGCVKVNHGASSSNTTYIYANHTATITTSLNAPMYVTLYPDDYYCGHMSITYDYQQQQGGDERGGTRGGSSSNSGTIFNEYTSFYSWNPHESGESVTIRFDVNKLTIGKSPTTGGSFSVMPNDTGIDSNNSVGISLSTNERAYKSDLENSRVYLQANPGSNYTFKEWTISGDTTNLQPISAMPRQLNGRITQPTTATMNFYCTVTVNANNNSYGTVSGGGSTCSVGESCTITATANQNYVFSEWKRNNSSFAGNNVPTYTFTVTDNVVYTAIFEVNPSSLPVVTSIEPSNITSDSARVGGQITSNSSGITRKYVAYKPSASTGSWTEETITGTGTNIIKTLTGLTPETQYMVKACAINQYGTGESSVKTFTTTEIEPILTVPICTSMTATTAAIQGTVNRNNGYAITEFGIYHNSSSSTSGGTHVQASGSAGNSTTTFSVNIIGLTQGSNVYMRTYAKTSINKYYYSTSAVFQSGDAPTIQITQEQPVVTQTTISFVCEITDDGYGTLNLYNISRVGVYYSTTPNPGPNNGNVIEYELNGGGGQTRGTDDGEGTRSSSSQTENGENEGNEGNDSKSSVSPRSGENLLFDITIGNLSASTTYYIRAFAENAYHTGNAAGFSSMITVQTSAQPTSPTVTSNTIQNLSTSTVTCVGTITSNGNAAITDCGVKYGVTSNPTTIISAQPIVQSGNFSVSISSLDANKRYYWRAFATNSVGTANGTIYNFVTYANVVCTTTSISITKNSATFTVGITNVGTGYDTISEAGVCYSLSGNPTISDAHSNIQTPNQSSSIISITSLQSNTRYYVCAFAKNTSGYSYSSPVTIKTLIDLRIFSCTPISTTSVSFSCRIYEGGGAYQFNQNGITSVGICWGTTQNPTISNSHASINVNEFGDFTTNVVSLTPNTAYHARVYAIVNSGTGNIYCYSNDYQFSLATVTIYVQASNTGGTPSIDNTQYQQLAVLANTQHTLHANVDNFHDFVEWRSNGSSISDAADYTFTATETQTFTAVYAPKSFTLTLNVEPHFSNQNIANFIVTNHLTGEPIHETNPGEYSDEYNTQIDVSVSAILPDYYTFVRWTETGSTIPSFTITLTQNIQRTAEFDQPEFEATIVIDKIGFGRIEDNSGPISTTTIMFKPYNDFVLTAIPNERHSFDSWEVFEDSAEPTDVPLYTSLDSETTFNIEYFCNIIIKAHFKKWTTFKYDVSSIDYSLVTYVFPLYKAAVGIDNTYETFPQYEDINYINGRAPWIIMESRTNTDKIYAYMPESSVTGNLLSSYRGAISTTDQLYSAMEFANVVYRITVPSLDSNYSTNTQTLTAEVAQGLNNSRTISIETDLPGNIVQSYLTPQLSYFDIQFDNDGEYFYIHDSFDIIDANKKYTITNYYTNLTNESEKNILFNSLNTMNGTISNKTSSYPIKFDLSELTRRGYALPTVTAIKHLTVEGETQYFTLNNLQEEIYATGTSFVKIQPRKNGDTVLLYFEFSPANGINEYSNGMLDNAQAIEYNAYIMYKTDKYKISWSPKIYNG